MNGVTLPFASLFVGLAYFALAIFVALVRLPRSDRLNLPAAPRRLWLRTRLPMLVAASVTVVFGATGWFFPPTSLVAIGAWMATLLGWTIATLCLDTACRNKPFHALPALPRALAAALIALFAGLVITSVLDQMLPVALVVDANIVFSLITLVLLENVMRNAGREILWHISLPSVATGGLALLSLFLYASVVLRHHFAAPLIGARLALLLMVLPLFAIGAMRAIRWRPRRLQLSKDAVFYSASLILGGSFMIVLSVIAELLHAYGTQLGAVVEWAIIFAGLLALAIMASSGSARSRLMIILSRHFAASPYDYRQEWLRCIATLSADPGVSVAQRAIKALADTADAPTGILLIHDRDHAHLRYREGWNTALEMPAIPETSPLFTTIQEQAVVELDSDSIAAPFWLAVALPDPSGPGLLGVVLLSRARAAQPLHREMAALLAVVAGEISLVMAERRAAEALTIARKFEETGKRFAFVAHDIKNVANQLGLLVDNAQRHITDPAFQDDLIGTVRESVNKIHAMIRRLNQADANTAHQIDVGSRLRAVVAQRADIQLNEEPGQSVVSIDPMTFDMIINHLLDNALEASNAGPPVTVVLRHKPDCATISVIDQGRGMSAHFVREHLFKPFVSTKTNGFGLGAFQTRELIMQASGTLDVLSDEAAGTTMTISLPSLPSLGP